MKALTFLCQHGGAKSVMAASYFNRAAEAEGLPFVATAVAAETPYDAVPEPVAELLEREGFAVGSFEPRQVTPADLASAVTIVSIGCDLTQLDVDNVNIERWDDVPMASADLPGSAAAIRRHVDALVQQLRKSGAK